MLPVVLTIAGSDSGGGAGIQADIKAISANGGFAASVITAITAQNTRAVLAAEPVSLELIGAQLEAVFEDLPIAAVKTGMLATAPIVALVSQRLQEYRAPHLVVDPVMISKSGYRLLDEAAIATVRERLIPLATLITPNAHEATHLTGRPVRTRQEAREAAQQLLELGVPGGAGQGGAFGR
ncbi:MAG: hypothetical protein KatS3mg115_1364 [Candidatus Poribacteria bacterium]|nr:MAG: hypothetical protein KatS3mg115_1364 [Candidatus Poribacteria bacterium]